ncbi:MAG: HEAT repeat domain-containing protein [Microcystaceae cyanobacterium]
MTLNNSDFDILWQQTQLHLKSEKWDQINTSWQNFVEDPKQLKALTSEQRQKLSAIALQLLIIDDFETRWHLAKWFPQLGEDCLPILLLVLNDPAKFLGASWFAVKMLGEFEQPEVIFALADLLNTTADPDLKAIAAKSLGKIGLAAINTLGQLLTIESSRFNALQALIQIPDNRIIDSLLTVINDANPQIRATAIAALGSFNDPRIFSVLTTALTDLNAQVRKEAVMAIGLRSEFGPTRLVHLKPLLCDLNLEVCQQTAIAVSRLQTPAAAQVLGELLQSALTPLPLQIQTIQALGWLENSESLLYLSQALQTDSLDLNVYGEIIRVMGRYREPSLQSEALQWLIMFWRSQHFTLKETWIRQILAQSLGQYANPLSVPILQILSTDSENTVRLQAIASLKKVSLTINTL